jgi:type VI secretion system protein ImpG
MDRRFLRYYEQELRFVRDLAGEFATEHTRIANRFGLDQDGCADPYVEWLLDGFAFLAARVQLKFDGEYDAFTHHLLEMIYPEFLSPIPAAGIMRFKLDPNASVQERGFTIKRRERLIGPLLTGEQSRPIFTTAHPVTIWPLEIVEAGYRWGAQLAALGFHTRAKAAVQLRLRATGDFPLSALALDRLCLHLAGNDRLAHRLYEALVAHTVAVAWRAEGAEPGSSTLLADAVVLPKGFADHESLFLGWPDDPLLSEERGASDDVQGAPWGFSGYRLLREYFAFPQRFMFVDLSGLERAFRSSSGRELDLFILLDGADPILQDSVGPEQFVLHATPIINLFRRRTRPILVEPHARDHHVVCDRVRPIDYEVYDVVSVKGSVSEDRPRLDFARFWRTDYRTDPSGERAFYAVERRPRLVSQGERQRRSAQSSYLGSEIFLTLCDGTAAPWPAELRRLDVEVLATNRDQPLRLRHLLGESEFSCDAGVPLQSARILGSLSAPRPSLALADDPSGGPHGRVAWQLIGHLALNYLSISDGAGDRGPDALRSLLGLYATQAEPAVARHITALRSVQERRVTRRLPGGGPITFGRGLEISLEMIESEFLEGSAFLFGSVLEAFFQRYVSINSFVETVLRTSERGEVMRWPTKIGKRHLL